MISVNTHEAKTRLSELLAKVEGQHERVVICRSGKPVAEMIPWEKAGNPLRQSAKLKKVVFHEDPSRPLDDEDWPESVR